MRTAIKLAALVSIVGFGGVAQLAVAEAAPPAMVIQADTVLGYKCILSSRFHRGQPIVWRIRVIDTKTGSALGPKGIKSLIIELPDGKHFPAHFGHHPPQHPVDNYWTYSWTIPDNYPTGSFSYKIVATDKNGDTATFIPFKVPPSQLTVVAAK